MKTYNAALQAQLDAYLSEQSGLPQSKAAAMIGVSPTALSQYRNSKYGRGRRPLAGGDQERGRRGRFCR